MIATVVSVSEEFTSKGAPYKKVMVVDGQGKETTKNVFSGLEEKWPLLEEGKTLDFKMEKKGQFWNVIDIIPAGEQLKPPQQPQVLQEHKKVVADAKPSEDPPRDSAPIAPQEQGMWFKEIGELYRAGLIKKDSPEGLALIAIYFARMKKVMGIETEKR